MLDMILKEVCILLEIVLWALKYQNFILINCNVIYLLFVIFIILIFKFFNVTSILEKESRLFNGFWKIYYIQNKPSG